jgi:hypothetical protein
MKGGDAVRHNKIERLASDLGQSLPGRVSRNSGHVRYAPKAEASPLL